MNNANYVFREPKNEPVYSYAPGTPERKLLQEELDRQYNQVIEIPLIIGGKEVRTGDMGKVVMPTEHGHVLANYHKVGKKEVQMRDALDPESFHYDESRRAAGHEIQICPQRLLYARSGQEPDAG